MNKKFFRNRRDLMPQSFTLNTSFQTYWTVNSDSRVSKCVNLLVDALQKTGLEAATPRRRSFLCVGIREITKALKSDKLLSVVVFVRLNEDLMSLTLPTLLSSIVGGVPAFIADPTFSGPLEQLLKTKRIAAIGLTKRAATLPSLLDVHRCMSYMDRADADCSADVLNFVAPERLAPKAAGAEQGSIVGEETPKSKDSNPPTIGVRVDQSRSSEGKRKGGGGFKQARYFGSSVPPEKVVKKKKHLMEKANEEESRQVAICKIAPPIPMACPESGLSLYDMFDEG